MMRLFSLRKLQNIMILLNIIIFTSICWTYIHCITYISDNGHAEIFLSRLPRVPPPPTYTITICILIFSIYALNITLRNWIYTKIHNLFFLSCILDLILCFCLIISTNAVYRGTLLLSTSCMLYVIESKRLRNTFAIILIVLYVICDYQVLSSFFDLASFSTYLDFLPSRTSSFIETMHHILFSINDILFVLFLFIWIQMQKDETSTINKLYEQQYRANEELMLVNIQLEHYMNQAETNALVTERNRLAREIHDTLGHSLTAIQAGLLSCVELANSNKSLLKKQLNILLNISQDTLLDVRRSVNQLRPDSINKLSLIGAISKMSANISDLIHTAVEFKYSGNSKLSAPQEDTVFHVIQESITNSVKHGHASMITITLHFNGNGFHLVIKDNGSGCSNILAGSGLTNITERISDLGGHVSFENTNGFTITAMIQNTEDTIND